MDEDSDIVEVLRQILKRLVALERLMAEEANCREDAKRRREIIREVREAQAAWKSSSPAIMQPLGGCPSCGL